MTKENHMQSTFSGRLRHALGVLSGTHIAVPLHPSEQWEANAQHKYRHDLRSLNPNTKLLVAYQMREWIRAFSEVPEELT